jgi:hypothetical protein
MRTMFGGRVVMIEGLDPSPCQRSDHPASMVVVEQAVVSLQRQARHVLALRCGYTLPGSEVPDVAATQVGGIETEYISL